VKKPAFWLWLILAAWPPEILAQAFHWDIVDPPYLGVMLVWWPVDVMARLAALWILIHPETGGPLARPYEIAKRSLPAALGAEALLGLKTTVLTLVGLIPALAYVAYAGLDGDKERFIALGLAGLGVIPPSTYALRRFMAPFHVLRQGLDAPGALAASARQTHGRLGLFTLKIAPWLALGFVLDLISLGVPEWVGLFLAPFSLACGLLALRQADRALT
jgi:hypothetical protein